MDDTIARMPDPPHAHLTLAVRTAQGVAPGALLIALAVGHRGDDFDRTLDDTSDLDQGLLNHGLDLGKRLGGLHPVRADPLKAFGKHMLNHAPDKRVDLHRFPLDLLAFVGPIMIGHLVPIIAINAPERDRGTHHILGQIGGQTLIPGGDISFLHIGHKPLTIARLTRIHQPPHLRRLDRLA